MDNLFLEIESYLKNANIKYDKLNIDIYKITSCGIIIYVSNDRFERQVKIRIADSIVYLYLNLEDAMEDSTVSQEIKKFLLYYSFLISGE